MNNMNTAKIAERLKRKTNNELKKYQFIGAELKSSRLKLSKTLDSIGNVSKSVSYISKIENNKIIPNERSLMELCDALYISKEELESMSKFDEGIQEALNALYKNDKDKLLSLYNEYSSFTNVRTDLMKGLYYVSIKNITKLSLVIENLKKIESSLSIDDYLIYVLLSLEELIENSDVLQGLRVTNTVLDAEVSTKTMTKLYKMYQFKIKMSFGISKLDLEYEEILKMHAKSRNMNQLVYFINQYADLLIDLKEDTINDEFIADLYLDEQKCYAFCKRNDLEKASEYYNDNISVKYKMFYLYKINNLEKLNQLLSTNLTKEELIIGNYYKLCLEENDELLRAYLIDILIPYLKSKYKINMLLSCYDVLVKLNSKYSKYKDSSLIGQDISNTIKSIIKELS